MNHGPVFCFKIFLEQRGDNPGLSFARLRKEHLNGHSHDIAELIEPLSVYSSEKIFDEKDHEDLASVLTVIHTNKVYLEHLGDAFLYLIEYHLQWENERRHLGVRQAFSTLKTNHDLAETAEKIDLPRWVVHLNRDGELLSSQELHKRRELHLPRTEAEKIQKPMEALLGLIFLRHGYDMALRFYKHLCPRVVPKLRETELRLDDFIRARFNGSPQKINQWFLRACIRGLEDPAEIFMDQPGQFSYTYQGRISKSKINALEMRLMGEANGSQQFWIAMKRWGFDHVWQRFRISQDHTKCLVRDAVAISRRKAQQIYKAFLEGFEF